MRLLDFLHFPRKLFHTEEEKLEIKRFYYKNNSNVAQTEPNISVFIPKCRKEINERKNLQTKKHTVMAIEQEEPILQAKERKTHQV